MTKEEKLIDFIKKNDLSFTGGTSAINSTCTILSGYAVYLEISNVEDVKKAIRKALNIRRINKMMTKELDRVFKFAYENNYGWFWNQRDAERQYKFQKA